MFFKIHHGDALEVLKTLPAESVNCCVTSPPYWRLRDYEVEGQIGDEDTIEEYLEKLVAVFSEVRRVLRRDGTLWLNLGDGYASGEIGRHDALQSVIGDAGIIYKGLGRAQGERRQTRIRTGLKPKNLIGMPWRLAFSLQFDGWYLRSDTIWSKPNPLPESVKDRPTKSHEYVFLLSKRARYYFDADAIKEKVTGNAHPRGNGVNPKSKKSEYERAFNRRRTTIPKPRQNPSFSAAVNRLVERRNARTVWTIPTQSRPDGHYAAYPDELARRCILSGCPAGGTVLDPFVGRGTTVIVALRNQRNGIGIDLSEEYCEMSRRNVVNDAPLLNKDCEE